MIIVPRRKLLVPKRLQQGFILNPFRFGGSPPESVTWDPSALSSAATLSVGNARLTANTAALGSFANARSTRPLSGLAYVSCGVALVTPGDWVGVGIGDASASPTSAAFWVGTNTLAVGAWAQAGTVYFNGSSIGMMGATGSPTSLEFAVNVPERKVWVRRSGGSWVGGGDPATNTSPTATITGSGDIYMIASVDKDGASANRYAEIDSTAGDTTGTPPAGFTPAGWV